MKKQYVTEGERVKRRAIKHLLAAQDILWKENIRNKWLAPKLADALTSTTDAISYLVSEKEAVNG